MARRYAFSSWSFVAVSMAQSLDIKAFALHHRAVAAVFSAAPLPRNVLIARDAHFQLTLVESGTWFNIVSLAASLVHSRPGVSKYFPFLTCQAWDGPAYLLVNDSNLDGTNLCGSRERFVQQRGLNKVYWNQYGFLRARRVCSPANSWSCQEPYLRDGGQWAVVSPAHRGWTQLASGISYPHEALAEAACTPFSSRS